MEQAISFRSSLVQAQGCSFQARVMADYGEHVEQFTLDCDCDAEGQVEQTVLQPESIAGITATVSEGGGKLLYDGLSMDFGLLGDGTLIPAAATAMVYDCWRKEYIQSAGMIDGLYRVSYGKNFYEKAMLVDTYFENGIPISAEVCYNGRRILSMELLEFTFH